MSAETAQAVEDVEFDPIEAILAAHDGDARAAIGDLVERIQHLRYQLSLASACMSRGMTRGWEPSMDQS
ncbi:dehydrogenase [Rhizobium sp. AC27/96]|uniref:dehydrogenase n=1 Tax=Rhizobium TaxID=379 RepID=UPI0008293E38|nr:MULTISPECIES: dehydrogenase [Rhizobium]NTF46211.1 dehydrogenase [Rhizobium rhizogenes]OCJ04013.1 dehydrogenase [Rhizobium sp. AC27/96]